MKFFLDPEIAATGYLPTYATPDSAAFDLPFMKMEYSAKTQNHMIHTGVYVEIPEGYFGLMTLRSSAAKNLLVYMRSPGIIDSDYRGQLLLPVTEVYNRYSELHSLNVGDRVAQVVILPCHQVSLERVSSREYLSQSVRGDGGFGSTGVK